MIEESLIYNNLPTEGNEAQISDVDTLSHRAMRYRKERNNYREKMNEIKVSLIQKDEAYRDAIKKSELFSSILKEQEFEIQSLKEFIEQNNHTVDVNELIHSKKVRTLRGGMYHCSSRWREEKQNQVSNEESILIDARFSNR